MSDIQKQFGKRLKKLRLDRKLTQEKLSELSGVEYKHIQLLESKNPPAARIDTIEKLAKALGVSIVRLLKK